MPSFGAALQCLVAVGFLVSALAKLAGTRHERERFGASRFGRWLRRGLGALELLGAAALLVGLVQPVLVFFAAAALVVATLTTAFATRSGHRPAISLVPALLIAGAIATAALQPLGLRVLALPAAAPLPLRPVLAARLVKTYEPGLWFESVRTGPDGTLFLAGNRGENYATGDKRGAHAMVIARSPDGAEHVFFTLPQGSTAGVIAFDADGQMYMTGQGDSLGVWHISPLGTGRLIAHLPAGSWPNGITAGPDHQLYVADASLGVIWRVDPVTGAATQAVNSKSLRARRFIALAPGANGLHFVGRQLYVTVSDAARVMRFTLGADDRLGAPEVFAEGIPGDDFAVDRDGSLYITTHPYNTVVRVEPSGRRTIVATAADGIIGATDAVFGAAPGDQGTLYVVTDGGAFSGNANARGTLIALTLRRCAGRSGPRSSRTRVTLRDGVRTDVLVVAGVRPSANDDAAEAVSSGGVELR